MNCDDNDGRQPVAWLPQLEFEPNTNPVVKVTEDKTGKSCLSCVCRGRATNRRCSPLALTRSKWAAIDPIR